MKMDTLQMIFSHHLWANLRLFERCCSLTDEQLDSSITGVFGSIRETLLHVVKAEQSYFSRISTGKMYDHQVNLPPILVTEMIEALEDSTAVTQAKQKR